MKPGRESGDINHKSRDVRKTNKRSFELARMNSLIKCERLV